MVRIHLLAPIIALSLWLITPVGVLGQGPADRDLRGGPTLDYPSGLSVDTGAGAFAIRDENISGQRYTGTLPFTDLTWARDHGRYIYRVGIELGQADDITNRSISSDITRFALGQAFLYPLAPRSFLGRDLSLFLGPATGLALLVNEQHLAVDALGFSTSVVGLLHLGLQADALLPLSERLTAHGSLRSSVLSLGLRGVDDEIDDSSPVKPLTLLTGADTSLELGIRYHLSGRFALRLAYRFQLLRVTAWNPVLAASDNLLGGLTWRF
jgi:hypothetical protein